MPEPDPNVINGAQGQAKSTFDAFAAPHSERARLTLSLVPMRECEACGAETICVDVPDLVAHGGVSLGAMRVCFPCRNDIERPLTPEEGALIPASTEEDPVYRRLKAQWRRPWWRRWLSRWRLRRG